MTHSAPPAEVTAFVDVSVVPMDTDRVLSGQTVLVEGGRIVAVGPAGEMRVPANARRVDGRGKYLIPGLADMHLHLAGDSVSVERALALLIANGVTTIRVPNAFAVASGELDGPTDGYGRNAFAAFLLRERARAAAGTIVSPRMTVSGPWGPRQYITGRSPRSRAGDPPPRLDSVAAYITAYKAAGYDFVKIHDEDSVTAESVAVAAHRVGIPVMGHVPLSTVAAGPAFAIRMGYTSLEHVYAYVLMLFSGGNSSARGAATAMRRAGVWSCPTLITEPGLIDAGVAQWPEMRYLPATVVESLKRRTLPADVSVAAKLQMIKTLQEVGVGILSGTDGNDTYGRTLTAHIVPGFSLHRELAMMVQRVGLTPYQALATSTRNVAAYLKTLDESGTVAVGKRADLVLLDANPLQDIRATSLIAGVVLGGRWLPRAALDRLLADARALTAR